MGADEKSGRARKKRGTLSVVRGGRKKRASEEKKGNSLVVGGGRKKRESEEKKGDSVGSWERAKKAGERGNKV